MAAVRARAPDAPWRRPAPMTVRERRTVPGAVEVGGTDSRFPALLREIDPPPASLFCLGDPALLAGPAVAVVGSRAATGLGLRIAETLGAGLAAEGVVVVSGLARGIDAAAHAGALSVGGATVAVLAGGLDVGAPRATRPLADRIAREGCVATEYEAGTPPAKYRFHERNRIVAGLARIVVVVEAGGRSGALITARLGLEYGREVMAVPAHPLGTNGTGVCRLLHEGAGVVRGPADVLDALLPLPGVTEALEARKAALAEAAAREAADRAREGGGESPAPSPPAALRAVFEATTAEDETATEIAERAGTEFTPTLTALTRLELRGLVASAPGRRYFRPDLREREEEQRRQANAERRREGAARARRRTAEAGALEPDRPGTA